MGSKTTSQVTTAANPSAQAAYDNVVQQAQNVSSTPYQPYSGQLVAPLGGAQDVSIDRLMGAYGNAQPEVQQGENYLQSGAQGLGAVGDYLQASSDADAGVAQYQGLAGSAFGAAQALGTPQQFSAGAIGQYENPYTQSVIGSTMANLDENDAQQSEQLASSAIGSGAYGGDRSGVAQAELARQQDLANNQTVAGLENQNYSQALGEFNTQNQMGIEAGSLMGQIGSGYNSTGQLGLGVAGLYGTLGQLQGQQGTAYGQLGNIAGYLGQAGQSALVSGASAGLQGATLAQQNNQQQDTAAYNQYMAGLSYPYQNVGFLSNIVQGIGSEEGQTQTTQGNALSSIAGLGVSSLGILGATGAFGSNGYLTGASGLGSSISSMFSDERVKDDKAVIGATFDGQPIYRFRYKGSPKVQMGLMAQDVEKRDPGAVGSLGGIKTVDYDRATRGAAQLGLGAPAPRMMPSAGLGDVGRLARAAGGAVVGAGLGLGALPLAAAPASGLGAAPPAAMMRPAGGLGTRPHFDGGGAAIPGGGISFGGTPGAGGQGLGAAALNVSPSGLANPAAGPVIPQQPLGVMRSGPGSGLGVQPISFASQPSGQAGLGTPSPLASQGAGASGLGATPPAAGTSGTDGGGLGSVSNEAWLALAAAGAGMASGTSMSFGANAGQGIMDGLKTYETLQQQDRNYGLQQQDLGIKKQGLAIDQQNADSRAKEIMAEIANQQKQNDIASGNLANNTANTNSEIAARNAGLIDTRPGLDPNTGAPGVWMLDRGNINAGYRFVPLQGGSAAPISFGSSADTGLSAAPAPSFSAPSSGSGPAPTTPVPVSPRGQPDGTGTIPGAIAPAPGFSSPSTAQGSSAATLSTPSSGAAAGSWQPTTSVPRGFVPPNQAMISLNPDAQKQQSDIGAKAVEQSRTDAAKASAAQMQLYQMNAAIDSLPKTGLLAPGTFGDERAAIAKAANTVATTLGADPVFDPNDIGNAEAVKKDAFRLGTQMIASSNGGREAGFILQSSVNATPSMNNSYLGFKRVAAGIQQANQYNIDKSSFRDDYYAKFGHLNGADQEFEKLNPWQNYAQRAIDSSTMPASAPSGVPQGSAYSMSRQMWRAPDGSLYNATGQRLQ